MSNEFKIIDDFIDNLDDWISDRMGSADPDSNMHHRTAAIQVGALIFEYFSSHCEEILEVLEKAPKYLEQRNLW